MQRYRGLRTLGRRSETLCQSKASTLGRAARRLQSKRNAWIGSSLTAFRQGTLPQAKRGWDPSVLLDSCQVRVLTLAYRYRLLV